MDILDRWLQHHMLGGIGHKKADIGNPSALPSKFREQTNVGSAVDFVHRLFDGFPPQVFEFVVTAFHGLDKLPELLDAPPSRQAN
jgi:hypothetical protein